MKLIIRVGLVVWVMLGFAATSRAVVVDLTSVGSSGIVNGAYFYQASRASIDTNSLIKPFLRMSGNPTEQGYNSDGSFQPGFNNVGRFWNHSIRVNDVPLVEQNGVLYREFLLDINQSAASSLLSLDKIEVYLADSGNLTAYPNLGTRIYSLDSEGADNYIKLDDSLNPDRAFGDMIFYLPDNLFFGNNQYVYLYSLFGLNHPANYSFEEWAVRIDSPSPVNIIPEPATLMLCGLGLGLVGLVRRRPGTRA